jgi:deoxyribonuclease-4
VARLKNFAWLLEQISHIRRICICVDTCHIFAAGYDFRTAEGYAAVFDRLLSLVGSDRIKAFHLNDSQGKLGSHLDRHAAIGEGQIGLEGFRLLVNDPRFDQLPMVLETPKDADGTADRHNLSILHSLRSSSNIAEIPQLKEPQ